MDPQRQAWWERRAPRHLLIDGVPTEVFGTEAFATVLNRSSITVRRWEREGVLPPTPWVYEPPDTRHLSLHDPRRYRRRRGVFPRSYIVAAERLATEFGLHDAGRKETPTPAFTELLGVEVLRILRATRPVATEPGSRLLAG